VRDPDALSEFFNEETKREYQKVLKQKADQLIVGGAGNISEGRCKRCRSQYCLGNQNNWTAFRQHSQKMLTPFPCQNWFSCNMESIGRKKHLPKPFKNKQHRGYECASAT